MRVTFSTLYGSPTCLWSAWTPVVTGRCSALTKLLVWLTVSVRSSKRCTSGMRQKDVGARRSRRRSYGSPFWNRRLRPVRRICFTRMLRISSPTSRILVSLSRLICVQRFWSTRHRMRRQSVILPQ